jgi:hypothetical protein
MEKAPLFREVQRFRQPWIWTLLGSIALLMLVLGPVSWVGLVVVSLVAGLVYSLRLKTEVRADGIYLKMWPLHARSVDYRGRRLNSTKPHSTAHSASSAVGGSAGHQGNLHTTYMVIKGSGSNGRTSVQCLSVLNARKNSSRPSTRQYSSIFVDS